MIEGNEKVYNSRITYKTIMSTIINMNLRDKIKVIRTNNLEETIDKKINIDIEDVNLKLITTSNLI